MSKFRTYLGDGLYADFDGFQIALSAENGICATDTVYLDPSTLASFDRWRATHFQKTPQSTEG